MPCVFSFATEWLERVPGDYRQYEHGKDDPPKADIVIDTIAYDAENVVHYDPHSIGRLIVISSASVYCDDQGRTLDEAAQNGFPEFERPIAEDQPTVAPGTASYSTRKVAMERAALGRFGERATVLRPCAIYGPFSRHPREYWFVKRMVDGRHHIPLALRGASQFQTTAATWIAEVALKTAELDAGGIYNIADAGSYDVREIGQSIALHLKASPQFVLAEDYPPQSVGRTPWSVPKPFVVDGGKVEALLGYHGPDYSTRMFETVNWLVKLNPADWRAAFPQLAAYPWDLFDYEAEDRFFG